MVRPGSFETQEVQVLKVRLESRNGFELLGEASFFYTDGPSGEA